MTHKKCYGVASAHTPDDHQQRAPNFIDIKVYLTVDKRHCLWEIIERAVSVKQDDIYRRNTHVPLTIINKPQTRTAINPIDLKPIIYEARTPMPIERVIYL